MSGLLDPERLRDLVEGVRRGAVERAAFVEICRDFMGAVWLSGDPPAAIVEADQALSGSLDAYEDDGSAESLLALDRALER